MGNKNPISKKERMLSKLFGSSARSKIISILIGGNEVRSEELKNRVNMFGDEYSATTIREHLTDLKRSGFVISRRDGKQIFWKINSSGNIFLWNFCELMKAPKSKKHNHENKIRKSTEEWIKEIYSAIIKVTKNKPGEKFTPTQLKNNVGIDSQRLNQILKKMIERELIGKVEGKRGLYFVKVLID